MHREESTEQNLVPEGRSVWSRCRTGAAAPGGELGLESGETRGLWALALPREITRAFKGTSATTHRHRSNSGHLYCGRLQWKPRLRPGNSPRGARGVLPPAGRGLFLTQRSVTVAATYGSLDETEKTLLLPFVNERASVTFGFV